VADARPMFIVNPVAGAGRGARAFPALRQLVAERTHVDAAYAMAERRGHAVALAERAASSGYDPIAAVGGDGTVNEVANGLLRYRGAIPRFAVIPTGTGNDFARSVGIPRALERAVAVALGESGAARAVDGARIGDGYFVGVAGAGFDARVARAVNGAPDRLKIGALPFVLYTLREIVRNRNVELSIELDGATPIRQRALLVAVSNCRYSGGGMQLAPDAEPDDGSLDVCIIGDVNTFEVVRLLPTVFSGRHVRHPKVSVHRARSIRIDGPPGVFAQADGDVIGQLPIGIEIWPRALQVLTAA
jgi:diacylglycerol kinase (ATP)